MSANPALLDGRRRLEDYDPTRDRSYEQTRLGRSVADFLAWKRTGKAAETTLDSYERALARGCLMFPSKGIKEFGSSELLHVAASFSEPQRRARVVAWRSFFKWAMRMGLIERNPVDRLPDIKQEPQKFIDVFSDEEILLLTDLSVRDGALMQLLFDAGLRKSEARNFRLAHLRVDQIVVLKGKGNKDRVLPATPDVLQKVNELVLVDGLNGKDYLWYSRPGGGSRVDRSKPIGDVSFHRWWKRCLDETGVPYRNPHVTRHTFATRYLRRGGSLSRLKRLMGHASIKTTDDLYAHLDTQDLAAEFSLLFPSRAET